MQKTKWMKRDPEWIKLNPGMGTMYKVYEDGTPFIEENRPASIREEVIPEPIFISKFNKKVVGSEPGLYTITCEVEKMVYVGMSENVGSRLRNHKMIVAGIYDAVSQSSMYLELKAHVNKHGSNCLIYKKHVDITDCTVGDLLRAETELMAEMIRKGYKLYNRKISKEIYDETIYCPNAYRDNMIKIVEWITVGEGANDSKFNDFVNSLTEG